MWCVVGCKSENLWLSCHLRIALRSVYCLLEAVKIHIDDHSVSSRVIFSKQGWMEGWKRREEGRGGAGRAAQVGGAPLKIPIDWLISQKALKAS